MDELNFIDKCNEQLKDVIGDVDLSKVLSVLKDVTDNYDITQRVVHERRTQFEELDRFIERMEYRNRSDGTIQQYKLVLLPFLTAVNKPVDEITDSDIIGWLNKYEREHNISKRTKDGKRKILSSFFHFLMMNGYLHGKANPMSAVDPISYTKKVRQALTPREVEKLRIACGNSIRTNAILETLLSTGCRVTELSNMNIEDIDFNEGTAKIKGKGDKERIVFFSARALEFIDRYLNGRTQGALFVSQRAPHNRLKKSMFEKIINQLASDTEIDKKVFPHLLRHTFATTAINKGMDLGVLCDLMGHTSVDTTRIYAKNSYNKLRYDYDKCI